MSFHSKKCISRKKEMCKVIAIANQKGGVGKTYVLTETKARGTYYNSSTDNNGAYNTE